MRVVLCRHRRPPEPDAGTSLRLLLIGYFEGIDSERGIASRTADSPAFRGFLGWAGHDATRALDDFADASADRSGDALQQFAATVEGSSVNLSWNAPNSFVDSYAIEAGSALGLANFMTDNRSTSLRAPGVAAGTYLARIRALSPCGEGLPLERSDDHRSLTGLGSRINDRSGRIHWRHHRVSAP